MQEIHHRPPPSRLSQGGEFAGYLLAVVGGVVLLAVASYAIVPTTMWAAIPTAVGLFAVYRVRKVNNMLRDDSSSKPGVLERPATNVLIVSTIAAIVGALLSVTGTPAIGFPLLLLAFPTVFVAFGIKLNWAARRAKSRTILWWDLLSRGPLLVFGVWMVIEVIHIVAGRSLLGIPPRFGDAMAIAGMALPLTYQLLERKSFQSRLSSIDFAPVTYIVNTVPTLDYWTPTPPPAGESWRRVTKPANAPSVNDDPSNRRYTVKR